MTKPPDSALMLYLSVGDTRSAQEAGIQFARNLAGAQRAVLLLALAEQCDLLHRAVLDTGFSAEQARHAVEHFEAAALIEQMRIARAMTAGASGTA